MNEEKNMKYEPFEKLIGILGFADAWLILSWWTPVCNKQFPSSRRKAHTIIFCKINLA